MRETIKASIILAMLAAIFIWAAFEGMTAVQSWLLGSFLGSCVMLVWCLWDDFG